MAGAVAEIYGRVLPFARAAPFVIAIPFVAELAQHAAEVSAGMYAPAGEVTGAEEGVRLAFGAFKILAIFLTILFALRYWAGGGDRRRAARPTLALIRGIALVLLVQVGGEVLILAATAAVARIGGLEAPEAQAALFAVGMLAWLVVATYLIPWFVGLLTEDSRITLRRSVAAVRGRLWRLFGLLVAGYLPALALHYALGMAAMGLAEPLVWALMLLDSLVVAFLAVVLASAYFTLYRRATGPSVGAAAAVA